MLDSIQALLDAFPEGIIQIGDGLVLGANTLARRYLPQLSPGAPLPDCLTLPREGDTGSGVFTAEGQAYNFSCTSRCGEQVILFRPAPQTALTGGQLEGALFQLRTLLGDVLAEAGPATGDRGEPLPADAFSKTFHRLFRLLGNLEFMQQAAGEAGAPFRPVTMDLAGLCSHMTDLAAPLLAQAGVQLTFRSTESGLLIPGDPALLRRLLLGLMANAAREPGQLVLALRRGGRRALLTLSGSGDAPSQRQLAALLDQGAGNDLPLPGQGAGLGLTIARHIVCLHGGTMLVEWGQGAPAVTLSLPTGPLDGRTTVSTPARQADGGLDPVLVELADVLPADLFGLEGLD